MLDKEIEEAQRIVKTDAYQMSIGEIVSMYENNEIIINPDFQRLFRWNISQKSRFIESILLGIPIPNIFVYERKDGVWELIDGLQRVSTILEFIGILNNPDGGKHTPSILDSTKYLPSLHNAVWEKSDLIQGVPINDQKEIGKLYQLNIRRARIGIEILKRPSDEQTKYDLFQRLNAGGTIANPQELRNCIIIMINAEFFKEIKNCAENIEFRSVLNINDEQIERQKHMEYISRLIVHTYIDYDGKLDIEEYIDSGVISLANNSNGKREVKVINKTFSILNAVSGDKALRRVQNGQHTGRVGLVALECIAVGIAKNLHKISRLGDPNEFVKRKIEEFWEQDEINSFTSPGLRGTYRIQRTIPFGEEWFKP